MRELRFVEVAADRSHVLLEPGPEPGIEPGTGCGERFVLSAAAARGAVSALVAPPVSTPPAPAEADPSRRPAPGVDIAPRDIQVRVRAGESPDEVAASYGVPVERVMRFAGPVLDERVRITDEARRARARRSKGEGSEATLVVFGEAVDDRFAAHGIDAAAVDWTARRREDGEWVIRAQWHRDAASYDAEWAFHRSSRSMTALDDAAADLLSDRPIRPVTPPPAPLRVSLAAAPPLAPGVVAFPPLGAVAVAPTDELPHLDADARPADEVFDQEAADARQATDRTSDDAGGADRVDLAALLRAPQAAGFGFEEPPLPLGIADPTTRPLASVPRRGESDEDKAARATVPSWDDILLGVRRKRD